MFTLPKFSSFSKATKAGILATAIGAAAMLGTTSQASARGWSNQSVGVNATIVVAPSPGAYGPGPAAYTAPVPYPAPQQIAYPGQPIVYPGPQPVACPAPLPAGYPVPQPVACPAPQPVLYAPPVAVQPGPVYISAGYGSGCGQGYNPGCGFGPSNCQPTPPGGWHPDHRNQGRNDFHGRPDKHDHR